MSCQELERLFVTGASDFEARKHAEGCAACAAADRDQQSVRRVVSALVSPRESAALREALLRVPARTVDCENAELLIAQAIEEEIEPSQRARLDFHLGRCAGCAAASEALGIARQLVSPSPAPWFAGRLAASPARQVRPAARSGWRFLFSPKAAIALAYAAALVLMLTGFNPADLAKKARTEIPIEAKSVAGAAGSTIADRVGAFGEKTLRAGLVLKSRVFGYGRAAFSNALALVLKSEPPPPRGRPSSGQERNSPFRNDEGINVAILAKDFASQENS